MRQDSGVDGDAQRISQLCWMFFLKIIDDQDQELELLKRGYRSPIPAKLQWRAWAADSEGITGDELLAFVNDQLFPALKALPTGKRLAHRARSAQPRGSRPGEGPSRPRGAVLRCTPQSDEVIQVVISHVRGQRFESAHLHHEKPATAGFFFACLV